MTPAARPVPARRAGFSLLELVLVAAILTVIAAVAAPKYAAATARYRARLAARRIAADLALARRAARTAGAACRLRFDVDADAYELPGLDDLDRRGGSYRVRLDEAPYHADLTAASFGDDAELVFDGFGRPDSGGTIRLRVGDVEQTVVVAAGSGKATAP